MHDRFRDADLLGDVAHGHPGSEQSRDPGLVDFRDVFDRPDRAAFGGFEPRLEWLGLRAVDAAGLVDVDLEAGALGRRVVAGAAQAERGVEYVLAAAKESSYESANLNAQCGNSQAHSGKDGTGPCLITRC